MSTEQRSGQGPTEIVLRLNPQHWLILSPQEHAELTVEQLCATVLRVVARWSHLIHGHALRGQTRIHEVSKVVDAVAAVLF